MINQEKVWAEFKNLVEQNGRNASWSSEHFGDLIKFYTQYQPKTDRPLMDGEPS